PAHLPRWREEPPRRGNSLRAAALRPDRDVAAAGSRLPAAAGERVLKPALTLALLLLSAPVRAEGNGLLVGESARLHASFETEARYDSLAALGGVGQARNPVFDPADLITHLRPALRLDAPGAEASFEGAARLDYQ